MEGGVEIEEIACDQVKGGHFQALEEHEREAVAKYLTERMGVRIDPENVYTIDEYRRKIEENLAEIVPKEMAIYVNIGKIIKDKITNKEVTELCLRINSVDYVIIIEP